ncbi:hypothetical protein BCR37DRAFT_21335 [Protomyces lactucae-debilis]|uniref:Uncharacterized protein n=1 Tax=Protomyces lactucae-debilis TaxID=2754530 RepID=A0A1Y2FGB2_PROLT|nr:uncharacterized protein BCR37DRAFT_21335 [Protomyces lactucae-debilis]ORY81865.1 hypothetical protein BCR37DRAFT_21335 [Protomyces lactucae-debilis]
MRDLAGVPAPGIYDQVPQVVRAAPPKKKRRLDPNDKRPYGILAPPGVTAHVAKAGPLAADVRAVPPAAAKQEAAPSAPHVQTAVPPVEPRADAPIPGISLSKASPQRKPTEQPTNPNPPAPGPIVVNVASKELGKEKNAVLLQGTRAFKAVTRAKPLADCVYTGTSAYITIPDEPIDLTKKVDPCTSGSSSVVRMQVESLERHKPSTSAERPSAESLLTIQPLPKYPTKQFLRTRHAENRLAGRTKIEPVLLADSTTASPSCLGKAISSPPPPRSSPALVMYTRDEHEELINQPLPRLKVNKFNNRRAMPPHHQPTNEIGDCIAKARDPAKTLAMAHAALRSENDMDLPRREVYREPKTRLVYPD